MSGETKENRSAWTVDSAKEKLEADIASLEKLMSQRFKDNDKALQAALLAVKEDSAKIATAMEKRFDSVNEFRNQQKDIIAGFLPRPEHDAQMKATNDRVDELTTRMNLAAGANEGAAKESAKSRSNQQYVVYLVGAGVGLLSFLLANGVFK